ncbi:hypothetical protein C9374_005305 [Naegleria lovaniensis]|uniref:Uncharacterized protein n=1 Tax=Naegleria lovaniensis TaxID=51637 RepID=A0AA88GRF1_NAELO|nr:uncharacterized protein C9374_005305 [Naegleria lovaniensis]KAG2382725.1 hypothetical protein C9374_005305 [Naegleria lovaniensis]
MNPHSLNPHKSVSSYSPSSSALVPDRASQQRIEDTYAKMRGEVKSVAHAYKMAFGEDYLKNQEREIEEFRREQHL